MKIDKTPFKWKIRNRFLKFDFDHDFSTQSFKVNKENYFDFQ